MDWISFILGFIAGAIFTVVVGIFIHYISKFIEENKSKPFTG